MAHGILNKSKMKEKPRKISDKEFENHFGVEFDPDSLGVNPKDQSPKIAKEPIRTKEAELPLDMSKVRITDHAIERFQERMREIYPEKGTSNARELIMELLSHAKEGGAIGRGMKVKRLMAHDYEATRYFSNEGWRFVVIEADGGFVVKTVERKKPRR